MAFSKCEAMVEFAQIADPSSTIFSQMACSRKTITTKVVELHEKVLKPELKELARGSPFWSLIIDESTDSATQEQLALYLRFVDIKQKCISTKFLQLEEIKGHPDASNICSAIVKVVESECFQLPFDRLVGLASDGASVLMSPQNGVIGYIKFHLPYFLPVLKFFQIIL